MKENKTRPIGLIGKVENGKIQNACYGPCVQWRAGYVEKWHQITEEINEMETKYANTSYNYPIGYDNCYALDSISIKVDSNGFLAVRVHLKIFNAFCCCCSCCSYSFFVVVVMFFMCLLCIESNKTGWMCEDNDQVSHSDQLIYFVG